MIIDPKALIEQVRKALRRTDHIYPEETSEAFISLDQLSEYLAEQEKAVRVKVLEEVYSDFSRFPIELWKGNQVVTAFEVVKYLNQKIEEAKK